MSHPNSTTEQSDENSSAQNPTEGEKSLFGVIIHSFFVVPFLIAVFSVLLFAAVRILTMEKRTVYDYLEDVKIGGLTKRWQSAFELSKLLSNPKFIPPDERFTNELLNAFKQSKHDDDRVRQYLALAMARMGNPKFVEPLLEALKDEKADNAYFIIYALGSLGDKKATTRIQNYLDDPSARIRLVSAIALGDIGDERAVEALKKALNDVEPNVGWDAAIALAKMYNSAGRETLLKLLDRSYLSKFPEIDAQEQAHILIVAISAAAKLNDAEINTAIFKLGTSDQNMNVRKAALAAVK